MNLAWHYTIGLYFRQIVECKALKCIRINGAPQSERPVVWLSMEQYWEPTSAKACRFPDGTERTLSMKETADLFEGLYRIGIDPETFELFDFVSFRRLRSEGLQVPRRNRAHPIDEGDRRPIRGALSNRH